MLFPRPFLTGRRGGQIDARGGKIEGGAQLSSHQSQMGPEQTEE